MNKKEIEIITACSRMRRLSMDFNTPCSKCNISSICCTYDGFPEKVIDTWEKTDIDEAYNILITKPLDIKLEETNIQQLNKEDLNKFTIDDILCCIKYLDNEREKLLEEIQYDYECSLGWDI